MRIGIIRYWVGRPAAEHETVERLKRAAQDSGHEIVELRADGMALSGKTPDIDFLINLHFASGKSTDKLTYGALWNPIDFYHGWHFPRSFANQISNDFLISCGAERIDKKFKNPGFPEIIEPILSHTVSGNFKIPESRTDRKLFYIGVNWEKSTKKHGRHHELLKELDGLGILRIYGPKEIAGIKPWAGFKSYVSDLPFDGSSVIKEASSAGAVLVLSSASHKKDQIMTSRLFEGIAAGASIICDSHEFVAQNFQNDAWIYDDTLSVKEQAVRIVELLSEINAEPDLTKSKIINTQKIVKNKFNLSTQLEDIANHAKSQLAKVQSSSKYSVTALVFNDGSTRNIGSHIESLKRAGFTKIFIGSHIVDGDNKIIGVQQIKQNTGSKFSEFITSYLEFEDKSDFLAIFTGNEEVFTNYLQCLDKIEESQIGMFVTGAKVETTGEFYSNAINPTSVDWHCQSTAGLLLRRETLEEFLTVFGSCSINALFSRFFYKLAESGFIQLDPLVRFRFSTFDFLLGEVQGKELHMLESEIRANWLFLPQIPWARCLAQNIRIYPHAPISSSLSGRAILVSLYKSFVLPKKIDKVIRKMASKILK